KLQNMRAWKEQRILKLAERSQYNLHQFNVEADEVKKLNEELREELIKANLIQKYGNVINTIHWNVEMIRELLVMLVEEMKRSYEDIRIMMELEPNTKNETDVRFKDIATYGLK
ncbi:MAG: hypothetical protein KJ601_03920, partial [Nanoarchaeota archaeon]|nr:hypothetical protein [Nanoarchaeota archaeon]